MWEWVRREVNGKEKMITQLVPIFFVLQFIWTTATVTNAPRCDSEKLNRFQMVLIENQRQFTD
jgi:hypothetical protein